MVSTEKFIKKRPIIPLSVVRGIYNECKIEVSAGKACSEG